MKTTATATWSTNCTCTRGFSFGRIMMIACLFIPGMRTINSYGQSPGYCIPPQSAFNIGGLYISNVNTTGGLTNFTNTTGAEAASYGNYSSTKIASQSQGLPLTIFATNGGSGMDYNVYVDYNDNGVFTDAGELVLQMGNSSPGTNSGSFTIPGTAPPGTHRMRIRVDYLYFAVGYPTGPCSQLQFGETEDYGLIVTVPCIQPTTQATIESYTNNTTGDSLTVNWTRGDGTAGVLVVGRLTSSALTDPSSGTSYTADAIFGSGTQIGTGNFVVYNGTGTSVTVGGLTSLTGYSFTCYEYNATESCYNIPGSASSVIAGLYCRPPQSVSYNCCDIYNRFISNVTTTAGITNFTNTTGVETASYGNYSSTKIASQGQGSPLNIFATHPLSGMDYNVYVDYNDNGVFTDPGELVLQIGNTKGGTVSGSFTIPDNAPLGTHRMRVRAEESYYSYPNGPCAKLQVGETEDYGLTVTAPTGGYCIPGLSGHYNPGSYFSNVTTTGGISNFTNTTGIEPSSYGNYSSTKIASQAQNSPITMSATSTIRMSYNVYVDYNDNEVFTDPGELVLQMEKTSAGTISGSFSIPADAPLGTHRMRLRGELSDLGYPTGPCNQLEFGETEDYGLTVTVGCTPPTTQATIGNYTGNTLNASGITVNWTRGSGNNVLVVGRPASSALTDPSSGTSYTANTIFGSGTQIGAGNFVVYNGAGTSVTVSGLTSGTSYVFTCYEYDNTGICYKNPGSSLAVIPGLYCIPPPTAWYIGQYISNITTTGGTTNFTNTTGIETATYGNYSSTKIASQIQGSPITILATSTVTGTYYNVYVDYNDNGVFTDPGELVLQKSTPSAGTVSGSFTIPDNAPLGTHKMRVRGESYGTGYPTGPCAQLQYGETEDYGLTVTIDCTSSPIASITAGGSTTFCQGESVMLTSSLGASYLWSTGASTQSITVSSAGDYTVNVTNANGCSATSTVTAVTVNQPETWYLDADNDGHYVSSQSSCGSPGAGYNQTATTPGDCDDEDDTKWQSASLYIDNDGDGYTIGSPVSVCYGVNTPAGYSATSLGTDCNDNDAGIHSPVQYYVDADHDGFGSTTTAMLCASTAPVGYSSNNTDCNDNDASIHSPVQYYVDADHDGFGSTTTAMLCSSTAPVGYSTNNTDCDDNDAAIHSPVQYYVDADHDGYGSTTTAMLCTSTAPVGYSTNDTDCNDNDVSIHSPSQYYVDADHDGYGSTATAMLCSLTAPAGYSTNNTDCNDDDASVHEATTWYLDADNDGHYVSSQSSCSSPGAGYNQTATFAGDCNDNDNTKWRSAGLYIDNDNDNYNNGSAVVCYGSVPPAGYKTSTLGADCNDNDPSIHAPVQYFIDADGDGYGSTVTGTFCSSTPPVGYSTNNTDCNDHDENIHAPVQYYVDADHDGYGSITTALLCSSTAPLGYSTNNTDCNDNDAGIHSPVQYYIDADHDGYGSTTTTMLCSSTASIGYSTNNTDCNDNDAAIHLPVQYYVDADHDGYGSTTTAMLCSSTAPVGYSTNNTDCSDNNPSVHPGATEICGNGIDDNCDGNIDEGCTIYYTYYLDGDKDGYGKTSSSITSTSPTPPRGYAVLPGDCDDTRSAVHPGAVEICDGLDNNCNGQIDEGVSQTYYRDSDGDGYGNPAISKVSCAKPAGYVTNNTDCDDSRLSVHPGAVEVCDGLDNNCNGTIDEGVKTTYYRDADGDGYGNAALTTQACAKPTGYVTNNTDCNDGNAGIRPGTVEVCGNGIDDNCNGQVDENCSTCNNATNLTTTNITSGGATLNWVAAVNPVAWQVQYKTTSPGAKWKDVSPVPIPSARSVTISGLAAGQTYNWHIAAKCGNTWTSFADASSFKTLTVLARSTNAESQPLDAVEEKSSALKLYPNPSNGQFMVDLHLAEKINATAKLQLTDLTGRTVYVGSATINNGVLQKKVSISSMLSSGIYTVEIIANGKTYFSKLMYGK